MLSAAILLGSLKVNAFIFGGLCCPCKLDESIYQFRGVWFSYFFFIFKEKYGFVLCANSVDPEQMTHFVASDQGLHCLPLYRLLVTRPEWVKIGTTLNQYCGLTLKAPNKNCSRRHFYFLLIF